MEWVGLRAFIYFAADKVWRIEVRGSPDVEEKFGRGFEKGLGKRWRMNTEWLWNWRIVWISAAVLASAN